MIKPSKVNIFFHGKLIGQKTAREISEILECPTKTIYSHIESGTEMKDGYSFKWVDENKSEIPEELWEHFDRITKEIRESKKDLSKIFIVARDGGNHGGKK